MRRTDLIAAMNAAEEFLKAAKQIKRDTEFLYCGRVTARVKRRSMDLTHALADLRHPNR